MIRQYKTVLLAAMMIQMVSSYAQLITNNCIVSITNNAIVYADHSLTGVGNNAQVQNNGNFYITGDIMNNAHAGFFSETGTGEVILYGEEQTIQGANSSTFYTLTMEDKLTYIITEVFISNRLHLNNTLTDASKSIAVTGSAPDAITRGTGYIYTRNDASLIRSTVIGNSPYLFPLGSIDQKYYQPVEIHTSSSDNGIYSIALHDYNAETDGFSLTAKDATIDEVNDQYYYTIDRISGKEPVELWFYADTTRQESFNSISLWNTDENKWALPYSTLTLPGPYQDKLNQALYIKDPDFVHKQYTPARSNNREPQKDSKRIQIPNAFTGNKDGLNDFWEIKGIEKFPNNHVVIFNRWGEIVFETHGYSLTNHFDASDLMQDVYVYVIEVSDNKGYTKTYTGDLTILK